MFIKLLKKRVTIKIYKCTVYFFVYFCLRVQAEMTASQNELK